MDLWWDRLFPRFPRRSGGCQIIVVIPLQLLSLTLIQCFDVFQTPAVVFLKCAQQRKRFTYTNANKCSLRSSQYELQYIYRYSKGLNKMHSIPGHCCLGCVFKKYSDPLTFCTLCSLQIICIGFYAASSMDITLHSVIVNRKIKTCCRWFKNQKLK